MVKALEDMCLPFDHPETVAEIEFVNKYGDLLRSARGKRLLNPNLIYLAGC